MTDLDLAAIRCWEHDDCLEHPELGVACAAGQTTFCQVGTGGDWSIAFAYPSETSAILPASIFVDDLENHHGGFGFGFGSGGLDGDGDGESPGEGTGSYHGYIREDMPGGPGPGPPGGVR